jgi:hypothetical protein
VTGEVVPSLFFFMREGIQYAERSLVCIPRPQLDALDDRLAAVLAASVDELPKKACKWDLPG